MEGSVVSSAPKPVNTPKPKSTVPCKFFFSEGGCFRGDQCIFSHIPHPTGPNPANKAPKQGQPRPNKGQGERKNVGQQGKKVQNLASFPQQTQNMPSVSPAPVSSPSPAQEPKEQPKQEQAPSIKNLRVYMENIPLTTSREEVSKIIQEKNLKPKQIKLIMMGQKFTGRAFIEMSTMEEAVSASKAINGLKIGESTIRADLKKLSSFKKKLRKAEAVPQKEWPHVQEFSRVQQQFGQKAIAVTSSNAFTAFIAPRDPETFPYAMQHLEVNFVIPDNYPHGPTSFEILNADFPPKLKLGIAKKISDRAALAYKQKPLVYGVFVWIRNNLEQLMIDDSITSDFKVSQNIVVHSFSKPVQPVVKDPFDSINKTVPPNHFMIVFPDYKTKLIGYNPTKAVLPIVDYQCQLVHVAMEKYQLRGPEKQPIQLTPEMTMDQIPGRFLAILEDVKVPQPTPVAPAIASAFPLPTKTPSEATTAATESTSPAANSDVVLETPQVDASESRDHEDQDSEEAMANSDGDGIFDSTEEKSTEGTDVKPKDQKGAEYASNTAHRGIQLKCINLYTENVAIVECSTLKIVSSCERCKQQQEVSLNPNQTVNNTCTKCTNTFAFRFRPELLHSSNSVMGYVDKENASIFDILPSCFKVTCFACSGVTLEKDMGFGNSFYQINCAECFKQMQLTIQRVERVRVINQSNAHLVQQKITKKMNQKNELGIQRGKPLPNQGACKHYKKSKRWLRFPCCNRIFACDICHDDNSDHEHEWAKKMICGFCSCEQNVSQECKHCKSDVTGHRKSAFWEGGGGQRDRTLMSRNDNKKYAGLNKTKPSHG